MNRIRFVKLTAAFCVILLEIFAFNSFYQLKQGQYYEDPSSSVATNSDVLKDSVTILRDGDAMAQSLAFDPSKTNFYPILDETRIKQNDDGSIKKTHQDDDANKKPSCGYQVRFNLNVIKKFFNHLNWNRAVLKPSQDSSTYISFLVSAKISSWLLLFFF